MTRALVLGLLLASSPAVAAESIRCGSELISEGDTALELQAACGAPDHVDRRTIIKNAASRVPEGVEMAHIYQEVETWTYAPLGGQLMRLIEVKEGAVKSIRAVAVRARSGDSGCARAVFSTPATTGQVELTCGLADDVTRWVEERTLRTRDGLEVKKLITRERWIYVPGPGRLIRIFEFENGRLVRESSGNRAPR